MYQGENSPFYFKLKKELKDSEFYPKFAYKSIPKITFGKLLNHSTLNERSEIVRLNVDRRAEEIKDKWERKNTKFINDIRESYNKVQSRGSISISFSLKPQSSDLLTNHLEVKQIKPSPNSYFQTPIEIQSLNPKFDNSQVGKHNDKRVFKPMKQAIF